MPKIFSKNVKLNVIEYGDHCDQNLALKPLSEAFIVRIKKLFGL
jgi:hypothetical protein